MEARVFDSPIWHYDPTPALAVAGVQNPKSLSHLQPHHPETWKCAIWQVGLRCCRDRLLPVERASRSPTQPAPRWRERECSRARAVLTR